MQCETNLDWDLHATNNLILFGLNSGDSFTDKLKANWQFPIIWLRDSAQIVTQYKLFVEKKYTGTWRK